MRIAGVEIFADKMATGIKDAFQKLTEQGDSAEEAVNKLIAAFRVDAKRPELCTVFWLALAAYSMANRKTHSRCQRKGHKNH